VQRGSVNLVEMQGVREPQDGFAMRRRAQAALDVR
jgi:hypothetical protein